MSYGEVKNLARAFGLPGDAIAQIAKGESGMKADIQQRDPGDGMVGYGLLQMTPNAWGQGSAARRYMEKLGGIGAMKDPVKNMAMARFLYKSAGNKLTPWYGTRYLTNRSGEGTLGKIDRSRVPKVFGDTSGASLGGGGGGASGGQTTTSGQPDFGSQASQLPLIQALLGSQQQAAPSASIQAPDFTAHAVMPQGFGTVSTGVAAPQGPDIGQLAAAIKTLGGSVPASGQVTQGQQQGVGGGGGGGASGGNVQTNGYPLGRTGRIIGTPHSGTHTLGDWQSDNAVDIRVAPGTPMVALEGGTVVKVRHHPQDGGRFAGDQITIRGADGNSFFYAHGVAGVKAGQKVHRGDVIGKSGSANGVPHLHFGVEKGDPRKIVGRR